MAVFSLRPCEGREDIVLPNGKTTIGRGPFLGVSDKRVSRSHAVLEVSDGKLTVLPLHTNPTFYKTRKKEKFVALNKDEIKQLNEGDTISLLPDNLCYEIICRGCSSKDDLPNQETESDISKKTRNASADDEAKKDIFTAFLSKDSKSKEGRSVLDEFLSEEPSTSTVLFTGDSMKSTITPSKSRVQPAPLLQKSRRLPSWLQNAENETKSSSRSTGNRKGNGAARSVRKKGAKKEAKICTAGKLSVQSHSESVSDESGEEVVDDRGNEWEENGRNGALREKRKPTHADTAEGEVKKDTKRSKLTRRIPSDSENDDDNNEALPLKPTVRQKDVTQADKRSVTDHSSDRSDSDDDKPGVSTKAKDSAGEKKDISKDDLPTCPYGKKCYRKNPVHFREYSHTGGGEEANAAAEDSDDDRPLCPYGSSCYRRNPQHKRQFKHTEPAGRPKRKAAKRQSVVEDGSDEDGPNTYDYNDSFLDDNSDAAEESSSSCEAGSYDSDWNPQDDDADGEDVSELITEARGFLRNKKMTKPV